MDVVLYFKNENMFSKIVFYRMFVNVY